MPRQYFASTMDVFFFFFFSIARIGVQELSVLCEGKGCIQILASKIQSVVWFQQQFNLFRFHHDCLHIRSFLVALPDRALSA